MTYKEKLLETKATYPFDRWRKAFDHGLEQYTPENCDRTKEVFDILIEQLINIGENGTVEEKIRFFETAVLTLNDLEDEINGLIETGEREDLCELINQITVACGLNPENYADGEGIADLWREW
jgi:hypothetical protein